MWKFTIVCIPLLGYTVSSIVPRYEIQGTSVLLECKRASQEGEQNEWRGPYKGDTLYAESEQINQRLPADLRSRLFITGSNGQFDLRIVNAQLSDEGLYNCSGNTMKTYNLTFPALLTSTDSTYNRHILIDSDLQTLFVGQMNKLIVIELSNVAYPVKSTNVDFSAETDKINYCIISKPTIPYCQNHIRLITKKTEDILILCGTNADSPKGFELNITDMTYTSSSVPCSNDPFHNFTAIYVKSGNPNGEEFMYYASTLHTESSIQRQIPGTTDNMKSVISEKWMKDPQFVGSFDVGDRVFIFFRETAVETDPLETKIYSRVAKVCKKDIGGNSLLRNKWTSYQKAKLDCFIPGNLQVGFDLIQDVAMRDNVFYGLFTTNTGTPASAICAFNISSIDAVMDGSFKEQTNVNSFWTEVTTVLTPRPGHCTNDSMSLSDSVLQFIADHPLMHKTVQPMYGKPIFVIDDEELQQLELHSHMTEIVFYAASNTGKVYKLFFKHENTYSTSTFSPLSNTDVIWTLQHHGDSVYVGSDFSVIRVIVINCEKYTLIDDCVKDPHCGWVNDTQLLPENENRLYNRCRTIEYINGLQTENGVYTHNNYNTTKITPTSFPPEIPQYLQATNTNPNSITLRWVSGFDGGFDQTFIIDYRVQKTELWLQKEVLSTESDYDPQIYELNNLQPAVVYEIKVCAQNVIGTSADTVSIMISTSYLGSSMKSTKDDGDQLYEQIGEKVILVVSCFFCAIIGIIMGFLLFSRFYKPNRTNTDTSDYLSADEEKYSEIKGYLKQNNKKRIINAVDIQTTGESGDGSVHYIDIIECDHELSASQEHNSNLTSTIDSALVSAELSPASAANDSNVIEDASRLMFIEYDDRNTSVNADDVYEQPYTTLVANDNSAVHVYLSTTHISNDENSTTKFEKAMVGNSVAFTEQESSLLETKTCEYEKDSEDKAYMQNRINNSNEEDNHLSLININPQEKDVEYINLSLKQ